MKFEKAMFGVTKIIQNSNMHRDKLFIFMHTQSV